jgi:hypothetical protein
VRSVIVALALVVTGGVAHAQYYVAPKGTDTGNCTSAQPCKTLNYAAGLSVAAGCGTITMAAGTWNETLDVVGGRCARVGDESAGLVIQGAGPGKTFWNGGANTTGTLIVTGTGARVAIRQMYIWSTNGPHQNTIYVQQGGGFSQLDGVTQGQSTNQQFHCENVGSSIQLWSDYTVASGTLNGNHMGASTGCNISAGPLTATLGSNLIFGYPFLFAQYGSSLNLSVTWAGGPINGRSYQIDSQSMLITNGAGCGSIPGSSPGTVNTDEGAQCY